MNGLPELPVAVSLLIAFSALASVGFAIELIRRLPREPVARHESLPLLWRVSGSALAFLGYLIKPLMSARLQFALQQALARAGLERQLAPQHVVAAQIAATAGCVAIGLLAVSVGFVFPPWLIGMGGLVAAAWPLMWLRDVIARRRESLVRSLPFLIDLLAMSVESGLPLAAALPQAVERLPAGALRNECRRLMRDVKAGMTREEALRTLAARLEIPAITQFALAVAAVQRDGGAVVQTLRAQAEHQRNERFLRAEHRAAQAPVRMLFPLVVFIFPGTLAIVLYPVVSRMISEVSRWQ